jgi:ribosomal-protein-alanine N-acetyltransferase
MWKNFNILSSLFPSVFSKKQPQFRPKVIQHGEQSFQLREIETKDIKSLLAIEREVYEGELPWTMSAFLSELHSSAKHLYILAAVESEIVGFIGCRLFGNDAHITNVAVTTAYQNQGLGRLLMKEATRFALENNCETMSLEVRITNQRAQSLYRKLGFVSTSVRKDYYEEIPEDALEMILYLKEE